VWLKRPVFRGHYNRQTATKTSKKLATSKNFKQNLHRTTSIRLLEPHQAVVNSRRGCGFVAFYCQADQCSLSTWRDIHRLLWRGGRRRRRRHVGTSWGSIDQIRRKCWSRCSAPLRTAYSAKQIEVRTFGKHDFCEKRDLFFFLLEKHTSGDKTAVCKKQAQRVFLKRS